MKAHFK